MKRVLVEGKWTPVFKVLYPETYLKPQILTKKQKEIVKKLSWWDAGKLVEQMWLIEPSGSSGSYFGLTRGGFFEQHVTFEDFKFLRRNGWLSREYGEQHIYNVSEQGMGYF